MVCTDEKDYPPTAGFPKQLRFQKNRKISVHVNQQKNREKERERKI